MKKIFLTLGFVGMLSNAVMADAGISNNIVLTQEQYLALLKGDVTSVPTVNVNNMINMDEVPANIKEGVKPNKEGYFLEGVQLGVGLGALTGASAHVGYRIPYRWYNFWKNRFGFRLEYSDWAALNTVAADYLEKHPVELGDSVLDSDITGKTYAGFVDFYPFGGTWALGNIRLTGGYYNGDFTVGANLKYTDQASFSMDGVDYTVDGTANLAAKLVTDLTGPYLGAGLDLSLFGKLSMYIDAGLVLIDTPIVAVDVSGTGTISGYNSITGQYETADLSSSDTLIQELLSNTSSEYLKEVDEYIGNYFPVVKAGFLLRF